MGWGLCPGLYTLTCILCILEDGTSLLRTITKASGAKGATGNGASVSSKEGAR
jgi:hypothetical protein